jgi:hypothetical protein
MIYEWRMYKAMSGDCLTCIPGSPLVHSVSLQSRGGRISATGPKCEERSRYDGNADSHDRLPSPCLRTESS